jgi:hypothetical protein
MIPHETHLHIGSLLFEGVGAAPPNSASSFRPRAENDSLARSSFGKNRGFIGPPTKGRRPK